MIAEEHHYRRVLISQIRKVYADSSAATPKKYSYAQWAYFLKLLGKDENDPSFHSQPPKKAKAEDMPDESNGKLDPGSQIQEDSESGKEEARWSWIGDRSPLMGDKEEAEWLLEQFFQRLEDSLHNPRREKEGHIDQKTTRHHEGDQSQTANIELSGQDSTRGDSTR